MSDKKINHIRWGVLLNYLSLGIEMLVSILYTPLVLRVLGQSEHGLYSTVSSTVSWLSVLELGIGSSYIHFYARYRAKKDEESIASLNGLFLLAFVVIGIVSLLCGLFLSNNLRLLYADGMTEDQYRTAHVLAMLKTVTLSVGFPASLFVAVIIAHEKYIQIKVSDLFRNIFGPALSLILLLNGYGSVGMVFASMTVAILAYIYRLSTASGGCA